MPNKMAKPANDKRGAAISSSPVIIEPPPRENQEPEPSGSRKAYPTKFCSRPRTNTVKPKKRNANRDGKRGVASAKSPRASPARPINLPGARFDLIVMKMDSQVSEHFRSSLRILQPRAQLVADLA